jgi:hypothetical protein
MTKMASALSGHPDSTDEFVRDLEESGYPVDGSTQQLVPQSDGLSVGSDRPGFLPVQPDSAQTISPAPTESKCCGDVDEQGPATDTARAS